MEIWKIRQILEIEIWKILEIKTYRKSNKKTINPVKKSLGILEIPEIHENLENQRNTKNKKSDKKKK